jgi:hypothetical protein
VAAKTRAHGLKDGGKVRSKILMFVIGALLWAPFSFSKNIYVAEQSVGASNGTDCTNAYSVTWFNNSSNWGNSSTQITPGDIVHLCGTFTGTAGSTMLNVQGAGTLGRPITILFEPNAVLTAPYWSQMKGAISCNNHAYITIDGGSNGLIQNTANGTSLTYQQQTKGVDGGGSGCSNFTVQNLQVSNLYIRTEGSTTDSVDTTAIGVSGSNALVTHNAIDHSRVGVGMNFCGTSNLEISYNAETFVEHGITVGDSNTSCALIGAKIHDNDLGGGAYLWDSGSSNMWHHDPIHIFTVHTGSTTSGVQIYNNYIHGTWGNDQGYKATSGGTHITAGIFIETIGPGVQVFNNRIVFLGPLTQTSNGFIFLKGSSTAAQASSNAHVYNNVLVSDNEGIGIGLSTNSGHDVRNNIFANIKYAIYCPPGSSLAVSNYNIFFGAVNWGNFSTWSSWQGSGFDVHSKLSDPKLDSNYKPQSGSSAIGAASNLASLGINALTIDTIGASRPASGAWDAGAYVYGAQTAGPLPPTGITAIVQ